MSATDELVARLATAAGISPGFTDAYGRWQETSPDTRRALLADMGLATGSEEEARDSLRRVERLRAGLIPAIVIVEAGRPGRLVLRPPAGADTAVWRITAENGIMREGRAPLASEGEGQAAFDLHALPHGYHRLRVEAGGETAEATVIAAPPQCWLPPELRDDRRLWGVTAQVYGLRSAHNFGIGDFTDVAEAAGRSGAAGASYLGLSPLHALFASDRSKYSPYSPSSRLFIEPLYIDVTAVEGFAGSEAARLLDEAEFRQRLAQAREGSFVDYQAVWTLKRRVLDALWQDFQVHGDHTPLAAFGRERGDSLKGHATFEALSEYFWGQGRYWMGEWPEAYRDAHSAEVARFMEENAERVAFHAWLQFEADRQLGLAVARARKAGMAIGLYRDLAVGADRGGSEVWANPERFMPASSVGAPPDLLAPNGQNWGLPSFNPLTLEEQGLAAFRALVVANMRHSGAIRIDHAFQLRRLFLIPPGARAGEGSYVDFPFEAMLAVLRVESHRHRALVIAEDLGTAPAGFSEAIMASGVLSYRVLHFERGENASFKGPETYPRRALAVVSTHDLPTFRGWWRGLDVDLKQT
ncbi:MAG: 4-alpha-glucanotransferase, partial [Pseudomonadota bacterium]|nr:4-alpha-glucanotransferase [Pseudomonadota bacterium]